MNSMIRTTILIIALFSGSVSLAHDPLEEPSMDVSQAGCRAVEDVMANARDEVCDLFVDEAIACFRSRRAEMRDLDEVSAKKPKAKFIADAEAVKKQYETSIQVLNSYLAEMGQEACGNQAESVKEWIKEFTFDRKKLTERIQQSKRSTPKKSKN